MGDQALRKLQWALEGGFTSGSNSAYNGGGLIAATRALAPENSLGNDFKPVYYSPEEARGEYDGQFVHLLEFMSVSGKLPAAMYMDDMAWYGRMLFSGVPIVTTLPATPVSLMAATAIAATMSLTTQPNTGADGAQARMLQVTLSNATTSATAVTVTITGTGSNGATLTETVAFTAGTQTPSAVGGGAAALTSTLWTRNYFKTVNASGVACSAQPTGDMVTVGGVNAFLWQFVPDTRTSTLMSACAEFDDGSIAWSLPGMMLPKCSFKQELGKSFTFEGELLAKSKLQLSPNSASYNPSAPVGSRDALTNLPINNMAALAAAGGVMYADNIGSTPGTTQVLGRIVSATFGVDNGLKLIKTGDTTVYASAVGRSRYGPKTSFEATLLVNQYQAATSDPAELAAFLNQQGRVIRIATPGAPLPCGQLTAASGWPSALLQGGNGGGYGLMYDVAGTWIAATEKDTDNRQSMQFKLNNSVDVLGMGVGYQVWLVNRINPNQM